MEKRELFMFFIIGFSFLMSALLLIKSYIYKWNRAYLYCSMMFFTTLLNSALAYGSHNTDLVPTAITKYIPQIGLFLNQCIPVWLLLLYHEFLGIKENEEKTRKFLFISAILIGLLDCLTVLLFDTDFIEKLYEYVLFAIQVVCVMQFYRLRGHPILKYLAWSSWVVVIGFGLYILYSRFGVHWYHSTWFRPSNCMYISLMVDGVLFMTALNLKEISELQSLSNEKQQILSQQNELLERQVLERTASLNQSMTDLNQTQEQLITAEKKATQLQIRHAISTDLHDDVGSTLTSIQLLSRNSIEDLGSDPSKTKSNLMFINQQVDQLQHAIRDIVWAMQYSSIKYDAIEIKLRESASKLLDHADIAFHLTIDPNMPSLTSHQSKQLLMIYREALNNIVKHSQATQVDISCMVEQAVCVLKIWDNGSAHIPNQHSGSGLKNMRQRAEAMDGKIDFDFTRSGSCVRLEFELLTNV
ncbi:MAG: histidine kinase [Saprospiraceae bacterium]